MSFEFDPEHHVYRVDGKVLPSVTQIIAPLYDFSMVREELLELARERGSAVHIACELDDQGDLDEASVDPRIRPYLEGWRRFRYDNEFEVESIEERLQHPIHGYAGTLDRVGILKGKRILLDIKTTSALHPAVGVQLAGYLDARTLANPVQLITRRYAIQLRRDGTYRLQPYDRPDDRAVFQSLLTIHRFRERGNVQPASLAA